MCLLRYYQLMRICKDKKQYRYQLVQYALKAGIKPCSRVFKTSPLVVRKWIRRFKDKGYIGLEDYSRRPHNSPLETPQEVKKLIIRLKGKYRRMGAEQIKILENISLSAKTMRKIWRKAGVSSRRRKKKYIVKNNLREIKKNYRLFEQSCEDTKDLCDIPQYWTQMVQGRLPKWQYTFREISSGILFLAFANRRSLTYAIIFAQYINHWLKHFKVIDPELQSRRQTDNGSEYVGAWNAKGPSGYTKTIESLPGQVHNTIFPGAHRMQADVETIHNLVEMEFYEIEKFKDRQDFMNKAYSYQLFFNLVRPNTYKEGKSPWQLAQEKVPHLDKRLLMIPPLDLDASFRHSADFFIQGGNNVLTDPSRMKF